MPAIHKVTFVFDGRLCGWTESHWYSSATGKHVDTMKQARDLAAVRAPLLGKECAIKAIRVSTEGVGPDAMLIYTKYSPAGQAESTGAVFRESAAQKDVALQIRFEDADHNNHKLLFLRGVWDSIENDQGEYTPSKDWNDKLAKFGGLLARRQWGWFGSTGRTKERLVSAITGLNDRTTFTFAANLFPALIVGKRARVRVSGVNGGHSTANGVHVVKVTSQTECVTEFPLAIGHTAEGGFGSYNTYDFISYDTWDDQKIVTRETGAPLLESPGRQPRRARA